MSFNQGTFQGGACLTKTFCFSANAKSVTIGDDGSLVTLVPHTLPAMPDELDTARKNMKAKKLKNLRLRLLQEAQQRPPVVRRGLDMSPAAVLSTQLALAPPRS